MLQPGAGYKANGRMAEGLLKLRGPAFCLLQGQQAGVQARTSGPLAIFNMDSMQAVRRAPVGPWLC